MKKKVIFDLALNTIATVFPVALIQLVAFPMMAKEMTTQDYALALVFISALNIIPPSLGYPLSCVRLLYNKKVKEESFSYIYYVEAFICFMAMMLFSVLYDREIGTMSLVLNVLIALLRLFYEYNVVAFRIRLNFANILINNILLGFGYVLGILFFRETQIWQLIYLTGYLASDIYIIFTTQIWKEHPKKNTPEILDVGKKAATLTCADLLTKSTSYIDRLLIYPIMGAETVAVYYAASAIGKIISLSLNPISNVLLSYLSKDTEGKYNNPDKLVVFFLILGIIGYGICSVIVEPVLSVLYPQYVTEAISYIGVTNATAILSAIAGMLMPFAMKFCPFKEQLRINIYVFILYISCSLMLSRQFGLWGFCYAALISRGVSCILYYTVLKKEQRRKKHEQR